MERQRNYCRFHLFQDNTFMNFQQFFLKEYFFLCLLEDRQESGLRARAQQRATSQTGSNKLKRTHIKFDYLMTIEKFTCLFYDTDTT